MRLVSNVPFDVTEYCGHLIVTYLSEDKDEVANFLDELRAKGYHFEENAINLHTILNTTRVAEMEEHLEDCGCYILCLTSHFAKPSWRALCNHIWFQIGVLEARHPGSVIPYKAPAAPFIDLSGEPLQRPHIIDKVEELEKVFDGRFRSTLAKCNFYEDEELNRTVRRRLGYTKMEIALQIKKSVFEETLAIYNKNFRKNLDKDGFLRVLRDNLSCGARLISFGSEERLNTHLLPYREEMHTVTNIDYPINFSCKHVFKPEKEKGELLGEYWLEIILPIHRLLGVNFKCFIKGNKNLPIQCLKKLFDPNFLPENDAKMIENSNKLYFSLDFPNKESFEISEELGIGKQADYLFPQ